MSASVDIEVMLAARRAGVKRWWGDGARPLNLPGADAMAQDYRGPAYWRRVGDHAELMTPLILEPTPAQIARGERVLWIETTSQRTAMSMMTWACEHGWSARLSRSRYLSVPSNMGAAERRGRRLEVETVCLRLRKEPLGVVAGTAAALVWEYDMERKAWKPSNGVVADIVSATGQLRDVRPVTITAMQVIMGMKSEEGKE
jgi:hypothetical protein